MEKKDEEILIQFLHEQKKEIIDNRFSQRVMRQLPSQRPWGSWLFNALCTLVCLCLFFLLNGAELLWNALLKTFHTFIQQESIWNTDPLAWIIAIGVLIILGINQACFNDD